MGFRKPFRAPPLRSKGGRVIPFQQAPAQRRERINWWAVAIAFLSVVLIGTGLSMRYGYLDFTRVADSGAPTTMPTATPQDTLSARFATCAGSARINCIVDGDTFWFAGEKIRILDINTPEISTPRCDRELQLGLAATNRLRQLLNAGPFSLEAGAEETDRYGRKLRRVMRGGHSLGDILVEEGLAEHWQGFRRNWC